MKVIFGGDPAKWLITKRHGRWVLLPPINSIWATKGLHDTYEEARLNYLFQIGCDD